MSRKANAMRMVPSQVHEFHSAAEKWLFNELRQVDLGDGATALHSLNLSRHEYKRWGEIDFVLICPTGVLCLEVKGGGVACRDGIWHYTDRWGQEHRSSEGPFDQCRSGTYALKKLLGNVVAEATLSGVCFGWGVVFPDIKFPATVKGTEFESVQVLDSVKLGRPRGLQTSLGSLLSFWRSKERSPLMLDPANAKRLVDACRPNLDLVPLLGQRVGAIERRMVSLTAEQFLFLDALEDAPRILCTGGAGTGKTFLAVEAAKREYASGRSVLLVCRSSILAEFLRSQLDRGISVRTIADLVRAPKQTAPVEVLLADEAQDFLTFSYLQNLDAALIGGLETGKWRVFLDPNNQAGIYCEFDHEASEWLKSCGGVPLSLRRNCRNTEPIVHQTQLATGADIGTTVIEGGGPAVEFITVLDEVAAATALKSRIERWIEEGIEMRQITILSPLEFGASVASRLPPELRQRIALVSAGGMKKWPFDSLSFATIEQFKGLENHCIALVDLIGYDGSAQTQSELYVGMTRAHSSLWIAIPPTARKVLETIRAENLGRLAKIGEIS